MLAFQCLARRCRKNFQSHIAFQKLCGFNLQIDITAGTNWSPGKMGGNKWEGFTQKEQSRDANIIALQRLRRLPPDYEH